MSARRVKEVASWSAWLALVALVFLWGYRERSTLWNEAARLPDAALGEAVTPLLAGDEELLSSDPAAEAAVVDPASGSPPFYGFCPSEGPPVVRPDLAAVVNERLAELSDRAGTGVGSETLRRGLAGVGRGTISPEEALRLLRAAPDRVIDGFDYAAAGALHLGARALRERRYDEAVAWARQAARDAPADPAPPVLEALAEGRRRDEPARRAALGRAFDLEPGDGAVALAYGSALADTDQLALALRALGGYREQYPRDVVVAGLQARLEIRAELIGDFRRQSRAGVTVLWSPEVDDALAEEAQRVVIDALERSAALLGVERRPELWVFIYATRADALASTCVQGWARAVFDGALQLDGEDLGAPGSVRVYLEHESMHAQLQAATPRAPVWLHEGLAQYFAEPSSARLLRSYRFMVEHETWIPFSSLEGSFQVISDADDAGLAYHQSRAMVELLVDRGGPRVIGEALAYLRGGGDPTTLLEHLGQGRPYTGRALLELLERRLEEEARER